jgi:hypothetical protein
MMSSKISFGSVLIGHGPIDSSLVDGVDQGRTALLSTSANHCCRGAVVLMKGSIGEHKTTASRISESWLVLCGSFVVWLGLCLGFEDKKIWTPLGRKGLKPPKLTSTHKRRYKNMYPWLLLKATKLT